MTNCPNCGFKLSEHAKARSPSDHRRFFAVIHAAFHHWPENSEFQPDNAEHLRAYLLCKAGYRDVTTIPVEFAEDQPALLRLVSLAAEGAVKAAKGYAFIRPHGSALAVFSAKSIAWDRLDQKGFNKIREAVESVITAETDLKPDDILKHTEAAA
jgi:hypothetical protein